MGEIRFRVFNKKLNRMEIVTHLSLGINGNIKQVATLEHNKEIGQLMFYSCEYTEKYLVLMQYTGLKDKEGTKLYAGDILTSVLDYHIKMIIKYGKYEAYCPVDGGYMTNVGFYVEAKDYPQMPLGPTKEYATRIGNIYENQELVERN